MESLVKTCEKLEALLQRLGGGGGGVGGGGGGGEDAPLPWEEVVGELTSLLQGLHPLDSTCLDQQAQHQLRPRLQQSAVAIWNMTVTRKSQGGIDPQLNAKLRHIANNLVYTANPGTDDPVTNKKQLMMAMKTARAWLDVDNAEMAQNPMAMATQCLEKLRETQTADGGEVGGGDHGDGDEGVGLTQDHFKLLTYQAEACAQLDHHDDALKHIQQAREMLHALPHETGYLSMLCYNVGVECFQQQQMERSISWLRHSFELGKGSSSVVPSKQARTLRLLANVYLEMDDRAHLQKALNAIELANNEHCHPAGLFLKLRLLLHSEAAQDRVAAGVDELVKHPDLTTDVSVNVARLLYDHKHASVAFDFLDRLQSDQADGRVLGGAGPGGAGPGGLLTTHLELLLLAQHTDRAQRLVEGIISGGSTGRPLDMDTKKLIQQFIWQHAADEFEEKSFHVALQWYNYSLSLYSSLDDQSNVGKLHRNRAACHLGLQQYKQASECLSQAEHHDSGAPYNCFLRYKVALMQDQEPEALEALKQLSACRQGDGNHSDQIYPLTCLAAQIAQEQSAPGVTLCVLEQLVMQTPDAAQALVALRCLARLRLVRLEGSGLPTDSRREEITKVTSYIETAHDKLCSQKALQDAGSSINISTEASWFMKIAWNLALQCEDMCPEMETLFLLCSKLIEMGARDAAGLLRQKTCLLMVGAATLQLARDEKSADKKKSCLERTLAHVEQCRAIAAQLEQLPTADGAGDPTASVLLLLYEFEARLKLGDPKVEQTLEYALTMTHAEPKMFETLAALAMEPPMEKRSLAIRALKVAIRKHLQLTPVSYPHCSKAFHSLVELSLRPGPAPDQPQREEAWGYYMDAIDLIATRAKGEYPEMEVLWLMTRAWNCGVQLYSTGNCRDAVQWCELGLRFLPHLPTLKASYEIQMTNVYSDILSKWSAQKERQQQQQQ